MQGLIERAKELLADGTVAQVLGWRKGDMGYDPEPAYFYKEEDLQMIARAHITIAAVKHTANDCLESRMGDGPHGTSAS